ncbi:MAG: methyltransferase domain-containing protein [Mycoplasmataceae bacterium]|jgi:predicted O-methyltransferase YrrM|nr:methyltransferase domain-containing protein [Mycoplasmataceae bacterium]
MLLSDQIKVKSLEEHIPIVREKTIAYILNLARENSYKNVLEVGTAYGYSAACFFEANFDVTTIEKSEKNYQIAMSFLQNNDHIICVNKDAIDFTTNKKFDLIFLDGSKTHQEELLNKFYQFLNTKGTIIIDNIYLKKFTDKTLTKNQIKLMEKVKKFEDYLKNQQKYNAEIIDLDDGIAVISKP